MFAESGWLLPTIFFMLIWAMSSLSTTMYCEAMRKIPGNEHFRGRIEYSSIVAYYFGRKAYIAAQIGLNGALQSLNVISVIQSAQVMDNAISAIFGHSCGVNVSPFALEINGTRLHESVKGWSCIDTNDIESGNAWGCHLIVSMGFLVALAIAIPMGYFKLDDNMIVQKVAFVLTLLCWLVWLVACFFSSEFGSGGDWHIPAVTDASLSYTSQAGVLGTILFNFGFVTTVPSWVNEKRPSVSVNRVVWLSTFLCNAVFFIMGIPPAMAFSQYLAGPATGQCAEGHGCAQSIMDIYTSHRAPEMLRHNRAANFILQMSVYLFPIVAVLSSIPVFSIVIKYNCVENGWSHRSAFAWGVLFPWVIAIPLLYQPDALNQFITFSSLIFVSFTDFIVPWALYMKLQRREQSGLVAYEEGERVDSDDDDDDNNNNSNTATSAAGGRRGRRSDVHVEDGSSTGVGLNVSTSINSPLEQSRPRMQGYGTHADAGHVYRSTHEGDEESPLLSHPQPHDGDTDVSSSTSASSEPFAPTHYALPPSWHLSHNHKFYSALALVLLMTAAAIAGTVLQIETTASTSWDCAAVGQS
ncbi:hypothetical protein PTSG_10151 [Salpingoeca rosetta]|uniref:Amino acid transporter transmembrane domain-containing protein n=1 Tax=Salpingoeca rosetta (strain ATCC 50818 / BSB-021) TaxID=946362 RepID=F2UQG2_SALR5|nr:uncharacterized protein PTSG_10151 [Salpingoeca rosetta]EGD79867.1 hypothetical protein PTSG_10151 [Salpingoeca rosetta]|eukprot:XP_004988488.1 hypothetical protein PTSG_10151 [Salpingoeca rosetta]